MSGATLLRAVRKIEARVALKSRAGEAMVARIRQDPVTLMTAAKMSPDPWQERILRADADRTLILAGRQCFDADTVVLDRAGRACRISEHPDAWETGTRPVRRYTVRGSASVTVTDNHPLWGNDGWVAAGTLKVGDRVAVLSEWPQWPNIPTLTGSVQHGPWLRPRTAHVEFPVTEELGRLLGYLTTDGSNRPGQSIKFTNTRPAYLAEVEQLAVDLTGVRAKRYAKGKGYDLLFTTSHARHDNRLMDLVRAIRWDHRFPTNVFAFPPKIVAAFINRAWAGDGCIGMKTNGHPDLNLACKNAVYARYFQLLLMKFGVHSRMTTEWHAKATQSFHRLLVGCGRANLRRFFNVVGVIYGKEAACAKVFAYLVAGKTDPGTRKLDHVGEDGEQFHLAPIVKIEDLGPRPVWDIAVPGKGWLVAQGIKAHNSGKSTVSAALAVKAALLVPDSPILLLSPSQRQSGELFRKVLALYVALGRPVPLVRETALQLELANGSRVLSLPGTEDTVRGFSRVSLLVIDEAARVSDALYYAVRPMLAVSKGRLVALSTPFGQRGWFYEEWVGQGPWDRVQVTADQVPRITKEFLAEERQALGERFYRQEYLTDFVSCIDAVFDPEDIRAALSADVAPLFPSLGGSR